MPLKWERGRNPYVHSYFGRLRIGPNAAPGQINAQAKQLVQKLKAGEKIALGNLELDEHALNEADTKLRKPYTLAQELLLTHPQPMDESKKVKKLCEELRQVAVLPEARAPLPLLHPLAIFFFTPTPSPEVVELPEWEAFGIVRPGDEQDLALDVVFDS